jgi:hypothetical protein
LFPYALIILSIRWSATEFSNLAQLSPIFHKESAKNNDTRHPQVDIPKYYVYIIMAMTEQPRNPGFELAYRLRISSGDGPDGQTHDFAGLFELMRVDAEFRILEFSWAEHQ